MAERPHEYAEHHGRGGEIPAPPRLRASDADRTATVTVLQGAVGRGLLTPDEGSDRMAAAFAARYLDELPALTADLPAPWPVGGQTSAPGWRALGSLAAAQARSTLQTGPTRSARVNAALAVALVLLVLLMALVTLAGLLHGFHGAGPHTWGGFRHR